MSSIREAKKTWEAMVAAAERGRRVALLTLVHVRGSAYRRPGARMMMADDGDMVGTLSGGCLEGDLYAYAEQAMSTGQPSLHHYDLTEDEMWGLGIGCKGSIIVWIEPVVVTDPFWQAFGQAVAQDAPVVLGADLPSGARFLVWPDGRKAVVGEVGSADLPGFDAPATGTSWDGQRYLDKLVPPERLYVAGAGHDAEPVVRLALSAGFDVTVVDPRPHVNNDQHFPGARHLVASADTIDANGLNDGFWIIMNHHQRRDEESLALAMRARPRYVGVLGPLARTAEMVERIGAALADVPLYAPVGLDLGAETIEEVAVSIVSELMVVRRGARGGHLRGRDRIHAS